MRGEIRHGRGPRGPPRGCRRPAGTVRPLRKLVLLSRREVGPLHRGWPAVHEAARCGMVGSPPGPGLVHAVPGGILSRGGVQAMTQPPSSEIPAPMEGHGAYNRSSRVQAAGITAALPLLEQAARTVPIESSGHAVVLADYGSSQGHNSLPPIAAAIGALRERLGPDRAISVVHTDLPDNDFGALFHTLETDPASYLRRDPAAFASAVGRSFYGQILPSDSVTLGWSSWAVQWLSRRPAANSGPCPGGLQPGSGGARRLRPPGGGGLGDLSRRARPRARPRRPARGVDDGARRVQATSATGRCSTPSTQL